MRISIFISFLLLCAGCPFQKQKNIKNMSEYNVVKLDHPVQIDGNWNKIEWQNVNAIDIKNRMGDKPIFTPNVKAKMMYDDENLYVIFHVDDRYVRCLITDYNGAVYEEPAVEFFFSPDPEFPDRYFNLEINC